MPPGAAYRLWAESYDDQPDNLIFALDEALLRELSSEVDLAGKSVVDVGCGTGRHWAALEAAAPRRLRGVDSSPEMLERLRVRHPQALVDVRTGPTLDGFDDGSADVIVSTLMIGHVPDLEGELREWRRILAPGGDVVVTDFHPRAFQSGMRRTFAHRGSTFEVRHELRTTEELRSLFARAGFEVVRFAEEALDERARPYLERTGKLHVLGERFATPLVMGFHLRRPR